MVLELWEMIWRKVLVHFLFQLLIQNVICQLILKPTDTRVVPIFSTGLNIWGKYEKDLAKVVAAQQEVANAQKLLDLPVSVYLDLINVQKDMTGLRRIYDVYEVQKVNTVKFNLSTEK